MNPLVIDISAFLLLQRGRFELVSRTRCFYVEARGSGRR